MNTKSSTNILIFTVIKLVDSIIFTVIKLIMSVIDANRWDNILKNDTEKWKGRTFVHLKREQHQELPIYG
jgi:hypothetical protein